MGEMRENSACARVGSTFSGSTHGLEREGIRVRLETHASREVTALGAVPWLATLTYFHKVYVEMAFAWLTPDMSVDQIIGAVGAVGVPAVDTSVAVLRMRADKRPALVIGLIEPERPTATVFHEVLAAYTVCEAAQIMRADSVWAVRRHVSVRLRGLLGMRGRSLLPVANAESLMSARQYLATELFGDEPDAPLSRSPLRLVVDAKGA